MKRLVLVALLMGVSLFVACGGGSSNSGGGGNTTPTLVGISVTPASPIIASGKTLQFTAIGAYSDGTTKNLSSTANWLSSVTTVATMNTSGLATGLSGGTTTISASSGGVTGSTTLTVIALQSITLTPANPTVAPNGTQQFTATGNFSDGSTQNITSSVTWSATAGATITAGGLATGKTPGATATITATSGTISGTTTLTVTNPLVSIAVTPPTASIAPNATQQYTAIGTFADASTKDLTAIATWQSSDSNIASISSPGGLALGIKPGSVTITATSGSISGTAALTITNPLVSITVTPANPSVAAGTKPQFAATGKYFDNTSLDITTVVNWTSSDPTVATISNSPGLQGLATALKAGPTTITATCTPPATACPAGSPVSGNTLLTVTTAVITSIVVTPADAPISLGLQQQYTATATLSDSTQQDVTNIVTWTSSDPTKVSITTSGLASAVAITSAPVIITATAPNGVSGFTTVTVNAGNLVSISIKPANITSLAQGTSQQFSAIGTFNNGSTLDVTNQVTWASSDTTLATVAQKTGLVQAAPSVSQSGQVTITATLQSVQGSINLSITNATPTSITVTPVTATIPVGANQVLHATAVFSDGTSQDVSLNSVWSSSDTTKAIFTIPARLLGVAPTGPLGVTVTATFSGVSGTANVVVSTATLQTIALLPTAANLAPGSSVVFQATGNYSDGTTANLAGLATWASSDPTVAKVTSGNAIGQSAGTANITATYQGIQGLAAVLVTSSPLTAITVTPANSTTYVGVNVGFTATGMAGQQSINLSSSVNWASSSPSIATISNAAGRQGIATGVGAGTTSINAVFAGITGITNLTISPATITSLTITPVNPTIAIGASVQFKAIGTFSDGKTLDLTSQVTWASSAANVAPISGGGLASGATAGQTTITASFTQPGQSPITVTDSTLLTVQ
jgi:trimeric autotransporter adhesin